MEKCPFCSEEILDTFKFCPACGNNLVDSRKCPGCGYENEPNSKFCQECGTNLIDKKKPATAKTTKSITEELEPVPSDGITIEFPYSSAQSFDFAVSEAKKIDSFKVYGIDKKAIYRVTVSKTETDILTNLLEQLKGWRKRTVYVDGEKMQWDTVFGYSWCLQKKSSSYKPSLYCFGYENEYSFNLWGCMQANMNFTENSDWFTYGEWLNKQGDWRFDKKRIRHELEKNLYNVRYCPALNTELVEEILNALPDEVNPSSNKDWKFVQNWSGEEGLLVTTNQYGYKEKVYMKGVTPNGKKFIRDTIKSLKLKLPKGLL